MIGRSARRLGIDPAEAKPGQIKLVDKHVDNTNRNGVYLTGKSTS